MLTVGAYEQQNQEGIWSRVSQNLAFSKQNIHLLANK